MTKIYCADASCKYNGDDGLCKQEKVNLSLHIVATVHDETQTFNRCNQFEELPYPEGYLRFMRAVEDRIEHIGVNRHGNS